MKYSYAGIISLSLLVAACGGRSPSNTDNSSSISTPTTGVVSTTSPIFTSKFEVASQCVGMQSSATNGFIVGNGSTPFKANETNASAISPLHFKATGLGSYMLHGTDGALLAATGQAITGYTLGTQTDANANAEWTLIANNDNGSGVGNGTFKLFNATSAQSLIVDGGGNLALGNAVAVGVSANFALRPASGCKDFPELSDDVVGGTFTGKNVSQPVFGFADVHVHMSATDFLGGAHVGRPYDPFGVEKALPSCASEHGPTGNADAVGGFMSENPATTHGVDGYPTFSSWPGRDSLTHEGMYYRWVERAYKAGLRIMVNDVVENKVLCELQSAAKGRPPICHEMTSAKEQVTYMREMEDYIDAQHGGTGKGWFRIVTSPSEARQVIHEGKLAVVLGIEISHFLDCQVTITKVGPVVTESAPGCETTAQVDQNLQDLYDLGIRQAFPLHEFNNALGGNGIFSGIVLNTGNWKDTGQYWETYECPTVPFQYELGSEFETSDPSPFFAALPGGQIFLGGTVPVYPNYARHCNARDTFTPMGVYAIKEMMKKGMIIEIDHIEYKTKSELLDIAEAQTPPYPIVSTHGGHGGISKAQAQRIINTGGIIFPYKNNGADYHKFINDLQIDYTYPSGAVFGVGYGADTNGLGPQADPRSSSSTPVQYPFTLFSGPDWAQTLAHPNVNVTPVTFNQSASPEGNRAWDINTEGSAHYGLIADFVEEVRIEGGDPALKALFNSAEAYLQMWEKSLQSRTIN